MQKQLDTNAHCGHKRMHEDVRTHTYLHACAHMHTHARAVRHALHRHARTRIQAFTHSFGRYQTQAKHAHGHTHSHTHARRVTHTHRLTPHAYTHEYTHTRPLLSSQACTHARAGRTTRPHAQMHSSPMFMHHPAPQRCVRATTCTLPGAQRLCV
jgi:hypothetical protein